LVCTLGTAHAEGTAKLPNTSAGKVLADWLSAFNSGDAAQLSKFTRRHKSPIELERDQGFREISGGLDLLRIEKSEPRSIEALARMRDADDVVLIDLSVKPGAPRIIDKFERHGADIPPEFAPPRISFAELARSATQKGDAMAAGKGFSGNLLVARQGEVVFAHSWGLADRSTKTAVDLDTRFRIASMYKMFTAVATLQLVDAGMLSLDKTVGAYLPGYPNADVADKVTLRELLAHTGGTGEVFTQEFFDQREALREHADYLKVFGHRAPEFEPGSQDGYSNYGFILLGAIIEKTSGKSYYDYVREKIFAPAGMQNTDALPEADIKGQLSVGYTHGEHGLEPNTDTLPYRGTAAGGGYSTAGDLLKFATALQDGRLLSMKRYEEAIRPQNLGHWYGYGFMVGGTGSTRWFGHEGGAPGMNGRLYVYPELGYVVVSLANVDDGADRLASFVANRLPI